MIIKKLIPVCLAIIMILSIVACATDSTPAGGGGTTGSIGTTGGTFGRYEEPVTVTIGRTANLGMDWPDGDSWEDNFCTQWLLDNMNINVEFAYLVDNSDERLTLAIVAGEIPDIVVFQQRNTLRQLIENDLIADLTDVFEQYACPVTTLMVNKSEGVFHQIGGHDGRLYALAMDDSGGLYPDMMFIRDDWLEITGLSAPTTLDELIHVASTFVEQDLAGGGQTIGIAVNNWIIPGGGSYNQVASISPIFAMFGSKPEAWLPNAAGEYVYSSVQPETKAALTLLADMYQMGIIDREFATMDFVAAIAAGRPGIVMGPNWMPMWPLNDTMNNFDDAIWNAYPVPMDANGRYFAVIQSEGGSYSATRKDFAHPEILVKLFSISTQLRDMVEGVVPDWDMLNPDLIPMANYRRDNNLGWGTFPLNSWTNDNMDAIIGGRIYEDLIDQVARGVDIDFGPLAPSIVSNMEDYIAFREGDRAASVRRGFGEARGRATLSISYPFFNVTTALIPFPTDTLNERGADLYDLEQRTFLQIIMGEQPVDHFDEFVRLWHELGGATLTEEFNEQARAR